MHGVSLTSAMRQVLIAQGASKVMFTGLQLHKPEKVPPSSKLKPGMYLVCVTLWDNFIQSLWSPAQ